MRFAEVRVARLSINSGVAGNAPLAVRSRPSVPAVQAVASLATGSSAQADQETILTGAPLWSWAGRISPGSWVSGSGVTCVSIFALRARGSWCSWVARRARGARRAVRSWVARRAVQTVTVLLAGHGVRFDMAAGARALQLAFSVIQVREEVAAGCCLTQDLTGEC